jgi:hypothetical protein
MACIEHDEMVEAVAADAADEPLNVWILPRAARCAENLMDAHAFDATPEWDSEDRIAIP